MSAGNKYASLTSSVQDADGGCSAWQADAHLAIMRARAQLVPAWNSESDPCTQPKQHIKLNESTADRKGLEKYR